jgi:hypothetical protein
VIVLFAVGAGHGDTSSCRTNLVRTRNIARRKSQGGRRRGKSSLPTTSLHPDVDIDPVDIDPVDIDPVDPDPDPDPDIDIDIDIDPDIDSDPDPDSDIDIDIDPR